MQQQRMRRGFTVTELMISMTIMGIILGLAVLEFAMVFNHNNLMNANLTAEQNARIAMAKVTNELRQAMPDMTDFPASTTIVVSPTAPPPSTAPAASTTVEFYRVHNGSGGLVTPVPTDANGDPVPCYDDVKLVYDSVAHTISKTVQLVSNTDCPGTSLTATTSVLARNVMGFGVTSESGYLYDVDLQTVASNGNYGIYDLNSQVAMGYKP